MALRAVGDHTIYQCSLCVPPDIGMYWLHTLTRSVKCVRHGNVPHYEFYKFIAYKNEDDVHIPQKPFGELL